MSSTNPLLATADTQPTIPLPQTPSRRSRMSFPVSGMYNTQLERKNSITHYISTRSCRWTRFRRPSNHFPTSDTLLMLYNAQQSARNSPKTKRKRQSVTLRYQSQTPGQSFFGRDSDVSCLDIETFIYTGWLAGPLDTTNTPRIQQYLLCGHRIWKKPYFRWIGCLRGVKKLVIVISPLKALERNQVIKFSFWVINSFNLCF